MMESLEEIVQEMRLEMRELRTEVQKSNAVVLHESSARGSGETVNLKPVKVEFLFSAEAMQVESVKRIRAAEKGDVVYLVAYSFDRRDIAEALLLAHRSGVQVRLAVDSKQTLKGPKEQFAVVQELVVGGLEVRVVSGVSIKDAYAAAGRNVSTGFMGIQHMKMLAIEPKSSNEPGCVVLGSANWTTSSRANVETSVKLEIDKKDQSWRDLMIHLAALWRQSISLIEADVKAAQRSRSQSPGR
jgi:phosphatidylserine/phosphatidylglycerophosphate/cardiolipin synthase-like enzyme